MNCIARTGLAAVLATTVLAGCVSSSNGDMLGKANDEEAARYNVELGVAYMRQGERDRAMQKLQTAVKQDRNLPEAHTALALLYEQMGDIDRADSEYRRALSIDSDNPSSQNNYGTFLCRQKQYRKSIKYFLEAANNSNYPTPEAAFTNAGVCAEKIPDLAAAEKYYRKALNVNPTFADALWQMAALSYQQKQYLETRAFLQRFTSVAQPVNPEALLLGYRTERALGDSGAAQQYANRLRRDFPNSPQAQQLNTAGANGGRS